MPEELIECGRLAAAEAGEAQRLRLWEERSPEHCTEAATGGYLCCAEPVGGSSWSPGSHWPRLGSAPEPARALSCRRPRLPRAYSLPSRGCPQGPPPSQPGVTNVLCWRIPSGGILGTRDTLLYLVLGSEDEAKAGYYLLFVLRVS